MFVYRDSGLEIVSGDQNFTQTNTHRGPFDKSRFSVRKQKQEKKKTDYLNKTLYNSVKHVRLQRLEYTN